MRIAGYVMLALAAFHLLFAAFTGIAEGLAGGITIWERTLVMLVHPAGAAALLTMLLRPQTLHRGITRNIIGLLLAVSIAGDLNTFLAAYRVGTTLEVLLPLAFAVVPVLGLAYGIALRVPRVRAGEGTVQAGRPSFPG